MEDLSNSDFRDIYVMNLGFDKFRCGLCNDVPKNV